MAVSNMIFCIFLQALRAACAARVASGGGGGYVKNYHLIPLFDLPKRVLTGAGGHRSNCVLCSVLANTTNGHDRSVSYHGAIAYAA